MTHSEKMYWIHEITISSLMLSFQLPINKEITCSQILLYVRSRLWEVICIDRIQ